MGNVSVDVSAIKSNASALNSRTNAFISTLDAIQTGGISTLDALKGNTIDMLKKEWEKIYESIGDFKNNFSKWNEVVTLIAAAHSDFSVGTDATYRDTFEGSDTVKMNKEALESLGLLGDSATAAALLKFYNEYGEKGIEGKDGVSSYIRTEKTGPGDNDYTLYVDIKDKDGNLLYTYTTDKDGKVKYYIPTSEVDENGNPKLSEVDSQPSLEKNGDTYTSVGNKGEEVVTNNQDNNYTTEKFEYSDGTYRIRTKDKDGNIISETDYTKSNELAFKREYTDGEVSSTHWYENGQEIKRYEFSTESDGTEITKYYENDKLVSSSSKNERNTVSIDTTYENGKPSETVVKYGNNYHDESLRGATETIRYASNGSSHKIEYPDKTYELAYFDENGKQTESQLYNSNNQAISVNNK